MHVYVHAYLFICTYAYTCVCMYVFTYALERCADVIVAAAARRSFLIGAAWSLRRGVVAAIADRSVVLNAFQQRTYIIRLCVFRNYLKLAKHIKLLSEQPSIMGVRRGKSAYFWILDIILKCFSSEWL